MILLMVIVNKSSITNSQCVLVRNDSDSFIVRILHTLPIVHEVLRTRQIA